MKGEEKLKNVDDDKSNKNISFLKTLYHTLCNCTFGNVSPSLPRSFSNATNSA